MTNQTTVTLRNSFHHTEVRVRVPATEQERAWDWIQERAYGANDDKAAKVRLHRVRRTLCGSADCKCGTVR